MGIPFVSSAPGTGGAASAANYGSVSLNDTLTRCLQQLGDWMACPSAKTPEGKKIIENLRIRIARLEDQVARSRPTRQTIATSATPQPGTPYQASARSSTLGAVLNQYA